MGKLMNLQKQNQDMSNITSRNSVFGESIITQRTTEFRSSFIYSSDPRKQTSEISNGGYVSLSDSELIVGTSTDISGEAYVSSKRRARYQPGKEVYAMFTSTFSSPKENSIQRMGLFDDDDGVSLGYNGLSFGIFRHRSGVLVEFISIDKFNMLDVVNGTGVGFKLDPTLKNVYSIRIGYLGGAFIIVEVMHPKYGMLPLHKIEYPNTSTETNIATPFLPIRALVKNEGNDTDIIIKTSSVEVGQCTSQESDIVISSRSFDYDSGEISVTGSTSFQPLFTLRNNTSFGGLDNKIESLLDEISASTDGAKPVTFAVFLTESLLSDGGDWVEIRTGESTNSYSLLSTIDYSTAYKAPATLKLGTDEGRDKNLLGKKIYWLPGQYLHIGYLTSGVSDVSVDLFWNELF